jgi:small subunit ribosomal protein S15
MISKDKKQEVMKANARHEGDTGSSEVQVAVLTARIKELTEHLKANPKDNHSRSGLISLVEKRKKHLKYLQKTDLDAYVALKSKLENR